MNAADWERVNELFSAALADPDALRALIASDSDEVRRELERLLRAHRSIEQGDATGSGRRPGATVAGRYRLEYLLGSGGNGEAWLGSDLKAGERQVVIKLPHRWAWFRAELKRRFAAEAAALNRMNHPSIVPVLDSGETEDGAPFLVMPYIDGASLRAFVDRGPLPAGLAADICESLSDAIASAHRGGIVHRDIKPENVLVRTGGLKPEVFLIDFGIAMFSEFDDHSSITTRFLGTTQYMAPEQLLAKPVAASDVYAFSLLVYEMVCGQPLFEPQRRPRCTRNSWNCRRQTLNV